ncbi:MAG: hypothetical protein IRZ06_10950 [Nevskia sp.]|nr:hypothetical protein [Nevskia sp.]
MKGTPVGVRLFENKSSCDDAKLVQVPLSPLQSFDVAKRKTELVLVAVTAPRSLVAEDFQQTVAADDSAQISARVVGVLCGQRCESAHAHKLVVCRQAGPLHAGSVTVSHELPASFGQKPVIAASDYLCAILEQNTVSRFDYTPTRQHVGFHVATIPARTLRSVDFIACLDFGQRAVTPVGHQYRRASI